MSEKILSVFIDESGDFGPYSFHAPYYFVAMVLHDQSVDISKNINELDTHLQYLGYRQHAIHTGPLIRRESVYSNDLMENRKKLFHALFHFARKLNFKYLCIKLRKDECSDLIVMTSRLSKAIADSLKKNQEFFGQFHHMIVYYDNGQIELTKILTSVFSTLFADVEFRKVKPANYKLFQVADLVCTIELLKEKADANSLTKSEREFFGSVRDFKKGYAKLLSKKKL